MRFAELQRFARERGYTVDRIREKKIEWHRNDDHSMVGVCTSVTETYNEILCDIDYNSVVESLTG